MKQKLSPIKEPRSVETYYYKALRKLIQQLKQAVSKEIIPLLVDVDKSLNRDATPDQLFLILQTIRNRFRNMDNYAKQLANIVVSKVDASAKSRFLQSINKVTGVDMTKVLNENNLKDVVGLQKIRNEVLIKSIPEQFFNDIEVAITQGFSEGLRPSAIAKKLNGIKDISSVYGKLENRVKLIARNEIATINGTITKKRFENVGIKKVIWEASMDERTRPSHYDRDGKEFDLAKGCYSSLDGEYKFPAITDVNCRCTFIAVVEEN